MLPNRRRCKNIVKYKSINCHLHIESALFNEQTYGPQAILDAAMRSAGILAIGHEQQHLSSEELQATSDPAQLLIAARQCLASTGRNGTGASHWSTSEYQRCVAVLQNPHTPEEALAALAADQGGVGSIARKKLGTNPSLNRTTFESLIYDPEFRSVAVDNPGLPWQVVQKNLSYFDHDEIGRLLARDDVPDSLLRKIIKRRYRTALKSAGMRSTHPSVLRRLGQWVPQESMKVALAENSSTDAETSLSLFRSGMDVARFEQRISNGKLNLPIEIQKAMSKGDCTARGCLASAHDAAPSLLSRLTSDDHEHVRYLTAGNSLLPANHLRLLAEDDDPAVRQAVGGRRDAPSDILDKLSSDNNQSVRMAVAQNATTDASVLVVLAMDSDRMVAGKAAAEMQRRRTKNKDAET